MYYFVAPGKAVFLTDRQVGIEDGLSMLTDFWAVQSERSSGSKACRLLQQDWCRKAFSEVPRKLDLLRAYVAN